MSEIARDSVRDILLIGVARIGDTLLLTPAMRALKERYPAARLTVLAHPKRCEVLENLDFIDTLGPITKNTALLKGWLPGRQFDLAFVYGRDAALLSYALRSSQRVYCFADQELPAAADGRLFPVERPHGVHAVRERQALVEAAGVQASDWRLAYRVRPEEKQAAEQLLAGRGVLERRPRVGLQAFSFPTKAHRDWPLENFSRLIERVLDAHPDALFLILGDAGAAVRAKPLAERFPAQVEVVAGNQSLRASAALMSLLDLYVGVDTGPTHIAGALGVPMVAMYHHLYPGANLAPLQNPQCTIVEHPATGQSATAATSGMEAIPADTIAAHALERLAPAAAIGEKS
ncbi:MAG TPA: glycosyltransferase family 9 protein [Azonexus sp.]|nr:glycosyltransferase family 9 protein [Azonexus sp.]